MNCRSGLLLLGTGSRCPYQVFVLQEQFLVNRTGDVRQHSFPIHRGTEGAGVSDYPPLGRVGHQLSNSQRFRSRWLLPLHNGRRRGTLLPRIPLNSDGQDFMGRISFDRFGFPTIDGQAGRSGRGRREFLMRLGLIPVADGKTIPDPPP